MMRIILDISITVQLQCYDHEQVLDGTIINLSSRIALKAIRVHAMNAKYGNMPRTKNRRGSNPQPSGTKRTHNKQNPTV